MVYYGLNNTNSLKLPGLKMSALISVYEWIVLYRDSQQLHTRLVARHVGHVPCGCELTAELHFFFINLMSKIKREGIISHKKV